MGDQVDFVDDEDDREFFSFEVFDEGHFLLVQLPLRLDEEEDQVDFADATLDHLVHMPRQLGLRLVEAGGVEEAELGVPVGQDA